MISIVLLAITYTRTSLDAQIDCVPTNDILIKGDLFKVSDRVTEIESTTIKITVEVTVLHDAVSNPQIMTKTLEFREEGAEGS